MKVLPHSISQTSGQMASCCPTKLQIDLEDQATIAWLVRLQISGLVCVEQNAVPQEIAPACSPILIDQSSGVKFSQNQSLLHVHPARTRPTPLATPSTFPAGGDGWQMKEVIVFLDVVDCPGFPQSSHLGKRSLAQDDRRLLW